MSSLLPAGAAALRCALLNDWQRAFPLCPLPYEHIAARYGATGKEVIETLARLHDEGAVSRVGGVFGVGAGGAGLLCAMAVPPAHLVEVAARVSSAPEVNHNYERENALNLWFVVTAGSAQDAAAVADRIACDTGIAVLRLPMRRAFRIDLGFDLHDRAASKSACNVAGRPVSMQYRPLAAQLECGLPLAARPYQALGRRCGLRESDVLDVFATWCRDGTLRRFGVIVRHHELGWNRNAMAVFAVAEQAVARCGSTLAAFPGVTLCYQREPAPGWPYNLYCMVHGRSRAEVEARVADATRQAGLAGVPRALLFSGRRFKQTGSRYFAGALA